MKNLFVGNLDFSTTENELRSLFEGYGAVDRVSVVTDRDTGRSRGFAFVEMSVNAEAEAAISELFGNKSTLMIYSMMYGPQRKTPCPMCTSFLSSWNGTAVNLRERVAIAVTARSPIE